MQALADKMVGPLIYSISADAVSAAKVVNDFAKGNDKLVIKRGCMSWHGDDAADVKVLAATPSRDESDCTVDGHDARNHKHLCSWLWLRFAIRKKLKRCCLTQLFNYLLLN